MDLFAYISLTLCGVLLVVWLGAWGWTLFRDFGLTLLVPCFVAVILICGAVSAIWLIGTKVV